MITHTQSHIHIPYKTTYKHVKNFIILINNTHAIPDNKRPFCSKLAKDPCLCKLSINSRLNNIKHAKIYNLDKQHIAIRYEN